MKKSLLFFFFFLFIKLSFAQQVVQLSTYSEVSIITAGPGTELYEAFGHSAIRIKDTVQRLDLIYNYGMFDFDAPNFYSNFTKGKLVYKLGRYPFDLFLRGYEQDKRWVKQQVLNLTQQQRQAFFMYLENNLQPQNASYLYDPFYNNCASKLKDVSQQILGNNIIFDDSHDKNLSFRQLMNKEIPWNTWGSFGINVALGSKLDYIATPEQYMYLPDYVYNIFRKSEVENDGITEDLVSIEETILDFPELKQAIPFLSPLLIFSLIALIGISITISNYAYNRRTKWLDFVMFFFTGILGIVITFLWFFTDHSTTPNNFNILWAFAPNLFIAFFLLKNLSYQWVKKYVQLLLIFLLIIPILWVFKIQQFPISIIPFLILLLVRYLFLLRFIKKSIKV